MSAAPRWLGPELALGALALACFLAAAVLREPRAEPYEPGVRAPGVLRVVTWNVGGASSQGPHALSDERIEHVAATIEALEPDVVALQEVARRSQLERLRERLGGSWKSLAGYGSPRPCLLVREGELEELASHSLSRSLLALWRPPGRPPIAIQTIHGDVASSRERNEAIGSAVDELFERASTPRRILLGDFNLDLDLDKRRDLFTDDEHRDVETYAQATARLADAARGRGSTAEPDRRLDYVLYAPEGFALAGAGPWKGRRQGDMDHDPVVADLAPLP